MGNTTYTPKFRYTALVHDMEACLNRWQNLEPTLGQVADSVKSWQRTIENLRYHDEFDNKPIREAAMNLEAAWERRDNRKMAMKSAQDAYQSLTHLTAPAAHVPIFAQNAMKSVFGVEEQTERVPTVEVLQQRVKALTETLQKQIDEMLYVPQQHRQYLAYNTHMEGRLYQQSARRIKSWLDNDADMQKLSKNLTPASKAAIKTVQQKLDHIIQLGNTNLLDRSARRHIHLLIRDAYQAVKTLDVYTRQQEFKADTFQIVRDIRDAVDRVMPMLQSNDTSEEDVFKNITEIVEKSKGIDRLLPIKMLPPDTVDNVDGFGNALVSVLSYKTAPARIKALRAAAAHLDVVATDLRDLEKRLAKRNNQDVSHWT